VNSDRTRGITADTSIEGFSQKHATYQDCMHSIKNVFLIESLQNISQN